MTTCVWGENLDGSDIKMDVSYTNQIKDSFLFVCMCVHCFGYFLSLYDDICTITIADNYFLNKPFKMFMRDDWKK